MAEEYCRHIGCTNWRMKSSDHCFTHHQELVKIVGSKPNLIPVLTEILETSGELSGGDVNYYLVNITDPKRLKPYEAECEDIIEALNMTFAEGNVFKALWRSCAMRVRGHGKRGADDNGIYDGDKIEYYGKRIKAQRHRLTKK